MSESPVDPTTADGKLPDTETPPDAINLNVSGRELAGPERGFGQLWRKTYRMRLTSADVAPQEVIRRWKTRFGDYWQWAKQPEGALAWRNRIPREIVEIFERHGFIWGGRWYHFDSLHFEYRPELIALAKRGWPRE